MSVARVYPPFAIHPAPFPTDGTYRGECYWVPDGDTLDVLIDLGFGRLATERLRLKDFDAPEILTADSPTERLHGLRCKARVEELILEGPVKFRAFKTTGQERQTLGRYVAEVFYWNGETNTWPLLTQTLRDEHLSKADVPAP